LYSYAKKRGQTFNASEQQLIDCTQPYGNRGCYGGSVINALNFVKDNGIASDTEYPYVGKNENCKRRGGNFKITDFVTVTTCANLEKGLAVMPVVVAVDASNWSTYKSGILSTCGTTLNHFALLVGLSSSSGFWRIKNNWGTSWGESGYIRLALGNTCGVCSSGAYVN
jgi:C1A family cysteine protease